MRRLLLLTAVFSFALPGVAPAAPTVIWNTYSNSTISSADAAGGNAKDLFTGTEVGTTNGQSADASRGRVFWSNGAGDGIHSGNLNDTSETPCQVVGADAGSPITLVFNPVNDSLYWWDTTGAQGIRYAKVSSDCTTASSSILYRASDYPTEMMNPDGVSIDPANNKIYWPNDDATVGYANLDGTGSAGKITLSGACPAGFSAEAWGVNVDPTSNRMYVSGVGTPYIPAVAVADLDGSNCSLDNTAGIEVWGFTRTADKLFAGGFSAGSILTWPIDSFPTSPGTLNTAPATTTFAQFPVVIDVPVGTASVSPATAEAGAELTCSSRWDSGTPGMQYYRAPKTTTYTWSKDGTAVSGVTSSTLKADAAGDYTCTAIGTNYAGSNSATALAKVSAAPGPTPTPPPPPIPDNEITVRTPRLVGSKIRTLVRVPGAGEIRQTGRFRFAGKSRQACISEPREVSKAGVYRMSCRLTAAARGARREGAVRIRLATTFKPTGGSAGVRARTVVLRSLKPPKPRYTG